VSIFVSITDGLDYGWKVLTDQEVRLGVTGLSRGGKSTFITSLVSLVSHFGQESAAPYLTRLQSYADGDLICGGVARQRDLSIGSFPYSEAMGSLLKDPPAWPAATSGVSEIRLELRRRTHGTFGGNKMRSLYLDIWDYPGEWLMDLMLLNLDYEAFSKSVKEHLTIAGTAAMATDWINAVAAMDPDGPLITDTLKHTVSLYTKWLMRCKDQGLAYVVPGRFVLPGNLAGAPVLEFVPWLGKEPKDPTNHHSLYGEMRTRYEAYRKQVVGKFYEDCFSKLDRQIVLLDCLQALRGGKETYADINSALEILLRNFNYGDSGFLSRLFAPRIDRVLFAATKADLVTNDMHANMLSLLKSIVGQAVTKVRGEGSRCEYAVISAIKSTKCMYFENRDFKGQVLTTDYADDGAYFPGTVPAIWTPQNMTFFQENFKLRALRPPKIMPGEAIPCMNMDLVLDYILGDKL